MKGMCTFVLFSWLMMVSVNVFGEDILQSLAMPKEFTAFRISSYDTTGGNADGMQEHPIAIGETRTLAKIEGRGAITHIWITISSKDEHHLKNLVLRMYWDGEKTPSVEAPIGDFFGLGHAKYYHYSSYPIAIGTNNALNCFWFMPFSKGALLTVTNEGTHVCDAFYYYIDYRKYKKVDTPLRFHAQYRQEYPCGSGRNYTFFEAKGKGHYVGVSLSIRNRADGWWGEGDDMIYVDGEEFPSLHGTGSEDYFCGAWGYGDAFGYLFFGCPLRGDHKKDELWNVYRYHILDPIPFRKSICVTIEHGHANDRSDDFSSVAFWYQTEPHAPFPQLPKSEDRLPHKKENMNANTYIEKGVLEAETGLVAFQIFDDTMVEQNMSEYGNFWSNGAQLLLKADGPRSYNADIDVPPDMAGDKKIILWYTKAPNYGKVEIWLNHEKVVEWDGYNEKDVIREAIQFDAKVLPIQNVIEIRIIGKNEKSSGYAVGIDCLKLE